MKCQQCALWAAAVNGASAPGSVDSVCRAWQSQLAVLALVPLEETGSQHQRSHRLRDGLPEPLASMTSDTIT